MLNLSSLFLRLLFVMLGIAEGQNFPPPLSKKEEREAFIEMQNGNSQARARIIEHNLRLVSHIVRKYYGSYPNADELLSIGSFGLVKAVDTFRVDTGCRFATYGARCVQNEILMFFRAQKKTAQEISIHEQIDIDRDGNPLTYLDIIASDECVGEDMDKAMYIEKVRELLGILEERELEIIILRYGLKGFQPLTQREVAKHLGISRSYVSRIEKRALEKLKEGFGETEVHFDD